MTFSRRQLLVGSTALGLGALVACTSNGSSKGPSTTDASAANLPPTDGASGIRTVEFGRPDELRGVLPEGTLLALADGTMLRLGSAPDTVELVDRGAVLWVAGEPGSEPGQFHRITGAAAGPDGSFWIIDACNKRVQVLSPRGEHIRMFGPAADGSDSLRLPIAIAVAPDGRAYVADAGLSGVVPFAADGTPGELIGGFGSDHPFAGIVAVEIVGEGLVVVEALVSRVQVRDLDGNWYRSIELPEHFSIADFAVDGDQVYFVSYDGRLARTALDGSTGGDAVELLGYIGGDASSLQFGPDGLVVAARPAPIGMFQ